MDGSEPALRSPASSMVARLMCEAGATEGARSDGAENSSSDCGCNSREDESDCHLGGGASKPVSASGGASELAAAGGSTPEPAAAAASPEAAAAFGSSSSCRLSSGGASGRAAPEAAAAEAAVPEAAVPEAAVPEAAVPKAAAAEVAVPQSPRRIREVDVAEFVHLFSGSASFGAWPPGANKKPVVLGAGSEGCVVLVRRRSTNSPMAFKEWRRHMREELKMNDLFSVRTATVGRHR